MCIVLDNYVQTDIIGMVYNSPVVAPNYSWKMWITFSWPDGILLENTKGKPDGGRGMDFPSHLFVVVNNFAVLWILCSVYYFTGFIVSDSVIQGSVADFWELVPVICQWQTDCEKSFIARNGDPTRPEKFCMRIHAKEERK